VVGGQRDRAAAAETSRGGVTARAQKSSLRATTASPPLPGRARPRALRTPRARPPLPQRPRPARAPLGARARARPTRARARRPAGRRQRRRRPTPTARRPSGRSPPRARELLPRPRPGPAAGPAASHGSGSRHQRRHRHRPARAAAAATVRAGPRRAAARLARAQPGAGPAEPPQTGAAPAAAAAHRTPAAAAAAAAATRRRAAAQTRGARPKTVPPPRAAPAQTGGRPSRAEGPPRRRAEAPVVAARPRAAAGARPAAAPGSALALRGCGGSYECPRASLAGAACPAASSFSPATAMGDARRPRRSPSVSSSMSLTGGGGMEASGPWEEWRRASFAALSRRAGRRPPARAPSAMDAAPPPISVLVAGGAFRLDTVPAAALTPELLREVGKWRGRGRESDVACGNGGGAIDRREGQHTVPSPSGPLRPRPLLPRRPPRPPARRRVAGPGRGVPRGGRLRVAAAVEGRGQGVGWRPRGARSHLRGRPLLHLPVRLCSGRGAGVARGGAGAQDHARPPSRGARARTVCRRGDSGRGVGEVAGVLCVARRRRGGDRCGARARGEGRWRRARGGRRPTPSSSSSLQASPRPTRRRRPRCASSSGLTRPSWSG